MYDWQGFTYAIDHRTAKQAKLKHKICVRERHTKLPKRQIGMIVSST